MGRVSSGGVLRRVLALFAAGAALVGGTLSDDAAGAQTQRHGKTLLVEHRLAPSVIDGFNRFKPSAPVKGESAIVATMMADTKDWVGPQIDATTSANPYTLVVIVKGVARADGDATTMWHAGWRVVDKQDGEQNRVNPLPGIAKTGARAGERIEVAGRAVPTTFKEDRRASPMIGLVNARNLEIQEVRVQVWTGVAAATWVETLLSFRWALIGAALVALWWFGFRRT